MSFWPTADEERWQAVAALAGPSDVTRARSGPWRSFSIFPRIGFFVLGALCSGALWGMVELLGGRKGGMVFAGLVSLAAAEILIIGMKWFRAGVEEALHFCGILLVWGAFVSFSTNEKVLFVTGSVALLIAAVRLLNPILLPAAVMVFAASTNENVGAWICAGVGVVALALLPRRFARPSVDRMIASLVIAMPAAAYLFAKSYKFESLDWRVALALLVYGGAALAVGLRYRLHAPLIAIFVTMGAFAYEMRDATGMRLETRLIVWGSMLLATAVVLERMLRIPRNGITSEKLRDDNILGLLELAGAAALTPHAKPPESPAGLQAGGGSFGGGGATGDI